MSDVLAELLGRARAVLFDFDGPLSDVFAGRSASSIADELKMGARIDTDTDDPLEVLRQVHARHTADISADTEDALIRAERDAAASSRAESDGVRAMESAVRLGYRVAVVTNNAPDAVRVFLQRQGHTVPYVAGRPLRHPELMKPHPYVVQEALTALDVAAAHTVFVGDSLTDITAARACGVAIVAYANKPGKREAFERAGADVVIDGMAELVVALDGAGPRDVHA